MHKVLRTDAPTMHTGNCTGNCTLEQVFYHILPDTRDVKLSVERVVSRSISASADGPERQDGRELWIGTRLLSIV